MSTKEGSTPPLQYFDQVIQAYANGQSDGIGLFPRTAREKELCEQMVHDGIVTREENDFYALTEEAAQNELLKWTQYRAETLGLKLLTDPQMAGGSIMVMNEANKKEPVLVARLSSGGIQQINTYLQMYEADKEKALAWLEKHAKTPLDSTPSLPETAKMHSKDSRSLIERYITSHQLSEQSEAGQLIMSGLGDYGLQTTNYNIRYSVEATKKYRFSISAMRMLTYLCPPDTNHLSQFPFDFPLHDLWIELEVPLATPYGLIAGLFYRYSIASVQAHQAARHLQASSNQKIATLARKILTSDLDTSAVWEVSILDPHGDRLWCQPIRQIGIPRERAETFVQSGCETRTCQVSKTGEYFDLSPCATCQPRANFYLAFLKTAWHMISGAFAEVEYPLEHEIIAEQVVQRVPREHNPKKSRSIIKTYRYTLVTFDASVKRVAPKEEPQEHRGSWIEATQAIDPDALVYVEHHIAKTQRTLRSERYTHKRGQTISVKAHDKRIPMKVSELRRKITRVIASKYQ